MVDEARTKRVALAAMVIAAIGAGAAVHRYWLRELMHLTGDAAWVWVDDTLERVHPSVGLFVASLDLDSPPAEALLKVCGDREYVVYVNGSPAACGWSRPGYHLDVFDIGHLLRQGGNALAVEVRSPTPVGGLLLALDVAGVGRNVLVSGPAFRSRATFGLGPPDDRDANIPVTWGRPPRFPWAYPDPVPRPRTLDEVVVEEALRLEPAAATAIPGGGWLIVPSAPVFGYLWLEFADADAAYVDVRAAANDLDPVVARSEAQPVVRLRGQRRWLDPEPRWIGRVAVFGTGTAPAVELWPVPEEFRRAAPGVVQGTHGPVPRARWSTRTPPG